MRDRSQALEAMEQAISQIKTTLINSLSMDAALRDEANQFLIKQCEPDP